MDASAKLNALKQFYSEMEGKNHFELLGIEQNADDAAVRSAYFGLLKQYGADYFHQVTAPDDRKAVDEVNRRLRLAYDALGKKSKREAYIASLSGEAAPAEVNLDIGSVFEAEQATTQARALMERGEFGVAIQKLEKAQRIDPESLEIKVRLRYSQYMVMDVDEHGKRRSFAVRDIVECLEGACESMPNADYLRIYLGDIENLEGHSSKSIEWYKKALKINPDNVQAKRAINLIEGRAQKEKAKEEEPKSFMDSVKSFFKKLNNIKIGGE